MIDRRSLLPAWKRILAAGLCLALLLPQGARAAGEQERSFSDVPEGAWYSYYVHLCVEAGLMGGFSDGTFRPDRQLSVAELIVLTARLWSKTREDEKEAHAKDAPISEEWLMEEEPPIEELGLDFSYTDALRYVYERDYGCMAEIEQRLAEGGKTAADTLATREDLCVLLGGNMSSPVFRRRWTAQVEELDLAAYNMYMAGIMVGTGSGFELDRTLPRREAAAFLARFAYPELRLPDEESNLRKREELAQIHIAYGSFGTSFLEYKLELSSGKLWSFRLEDADKYSSDHDEDTGWYRSDGRNPRAENEGYQTCRELDQARLAEFKNSAELKNALTWGQRYEAAYVFDGLQCGITFTFRDGSEWRISCSNAFPDGWEAFQETFRALLGEDEL